jgi:hypothetical protein
VIAAAVEHPGAAFVVVLGVGSILGVLYDWWATRG